MLRVRHGWALAATDREGGLSHRRRLRYNAMAALPFYGARSPLRSALPMSLRPLIFGLLLGLVVGAGAWDGAMRLGAVHAVQAEPAPEHAHRMPASVDWSSVSSHDLDVAGLFVTARSAGPRAAMDSLQALAGRDRRVAGMGHALAHGLGRFVVTAHPGDRTLFGQCTAAFSAGCYHGVMEGYLAEPGRQGSPEELCEGVAGSGQPRYARRECVHGLGHALMGMNGGRTAPSLRGCDRLRLPDEREECWEGVYMEDLVRAEGGAVVDAGDSAVARHARGHGAHASGRCETAEAAYRVACWGYQTIVARRESNGDERVTLQACRRAPDDASMRACWIGFGKQTAGGLPQRADTLVSLCGFDGPAPEHDCLDGAVQYHVEANWSAEGGRMFCAAVPARLRATCFTSLGAHAALIYPAAQAPGRACTGVPAAYVADCRRGAAAPRS
jgi:hypothetical protein